MAVTNGRFLNSTMPFGGPNLKGSFDKPIYADAPATEPDFKRREVKTDKAMPGIERLSELLVNALTQGTAKQVGTDRSPKCSSPFIAQAQCEYRST